MTTNACHPPSKKIDWLLWISGLAIFLGYLLHGLFAHSVADIAWLHEFSHSVFELVNTIWWGVAVGIVMIAILGRIPREFVMSALGTGKGSRGVVRATLAGVLLDLCSHGILMVGAKLYERGASTGQVIAFLVASPWNSFSLTLILIALIGLGWTLAFILLSMIIAMVTGIIFDALIGKRVLPDNPNQHDLPEGFQFWPEARRQVRGVDLGGRRIIKKLMAGIRESRMVVRWILFGVVLASLVRALVPADVFADYFGPTLLGLVVTLGVATVIEVCSEGSTPLAADILTRAGAPGNSFAFLMGGVATDYTEIMVLKDTTSSWKLALFLPLISLPQIILLGWFINQLAA
jgi:uncharacterized membrane protein YraQ (UPF0718 family)